MPPIGKYNKLSVFVHQFNSTLTPGLVGESRLWFEHFSTKDKSVVDLLGVVMAAKNLCRPLISICLVYLEHGKVRDIVAYRIDHHLLSLIFTI